MQAILSAFGPSAWKAIVGGLIAALTFIAASLDAGAAIDLQTVLKAVIAALAAHQGIFWKSNAPA